MTNTGKSLPLPEYIHKYFDGKQALFAKANDIAPAQVTQWIKKEFVVIDHKLYSPRRELNKAPTSSGT